MPLIELRTHRSLNKDSPLRRSSRAACSASVSHLSAISMKSDLCCEVRAASAIRMHSAALLRNWSKLGKSAFISIDVGNQRAPRQRSVISGSLSFKWNPKRTKRSVRHGAASSAPTLHTRRPLTLVAGLGHWLIGSVDWYIVGALLLGSLPGISIGSYLATRISDRFLLPALASMLVLIGLRLVAS
jgi:hypothetical protein